MIRLALGHVVLYDSGLADSQPVCRIMAGQPSKGAGTTS